LIFCTTFYLHSACLFSVLFSRLFPAPLTPLLTHFSPGGMLELSYSLEVHIPFLHVLLDACLGHGPLPFCCSTGILLPACFVFLGYVAFSGWVTCVHGSLLHYTILCYTLLLSLHLFLTTHLPFLFSFSACSFSLTAFVSILLRIPAVPALRSWIYCTCVLLHGVRSLFGCTWRWPSCSHVSGLLLSPHLHHSPAASSLSLPLFSGPSLYCSFYCLRFSLLSPFLSFLTNRHLLHFLRFSHCVLCSLSCWALSLDFLLDPACHCTTAFSLDFSIMHLGLSDLGFWVLLCRSLCSLPGCTARSGPACVFSFVFLLLLCTCLYTCLFSFFCCSHHMPAHYIDFSGSLGGIFCYSLPGTLAACVLLLLPATSCSFFTALQSFLLHRLLVSLPWSAFLEHYACSAGGILDTPSLPFLCACSLFLDSCFRARLLRSAPAAWVFLEDFLLLPPLVPAVAFHYGLLHAWCHYACRSLRSASPFVLCFCHPQVALCLLLRSGYLRTLPVLFLGDFLIDSATLFCVHSASLHCTWDIPFLPGGGAYWNTCT